MFFKYLNKTIKKITALSVTFYIIFSAILISYAENYEWGVINGLRTLETSSKIESENTSSTSQSQDNEKVSTSSDSLNLECGSAILIEQNSRSSTI